MLAGGSACTVNSSGVVDLDHFYQEGGYATAQLSALTIVRAPNGAVAGNIYGGIVEYPGVDGILHNTQGYAVDTTDATGTSTIKIGGKGIGGVNAFADMIDTGGRHWTWQATGGFLGLFDQQTGEYPLAVTAAGDGINFGRSTEQNGVLFSRRFALGWSNAARIVDMDSAAPTTGYHAAGELVFNNAPTAGGKVGWVCTTAGTPGTWKPFGAIDA
jgi:hypothetical protein